MHHQGTIAKNINKWYRESMLGFRYLSRIIRAKSLRTFLKFCLYCFKLEKGINPVAGSQEKRILVIVVGGLGDCLLFDPLFRRLKEKWPGSRIDVLTGCFENMWERLDSVDNLIFFTPDKFKTPWGYTLFFRDIYRNRYDIVAEGIAMFPMRGIYPIFTSLVFEASRAPIRIGRKNTGKYAILRPVERGFIGCNENPKTAKKTANRTKALNNPYLTHIIEITSPDKRQYHESSQIFNPLGINYYRQNDEPRLQPDPPLDQWAKNLLRRQWVSKNDVIIGFTTETTRAIKSWPLENFYYIVEKGIKDNLKFVMIGLAPQPSTSPFKKFPGDKFIDLSGRTGLGEMISVIRQCNVFFSCDTGPSHIAQACRVPTVVLFGPSNEKEFGPFDRKLHTLILPPLNLNCRPCVLGPCVRGTSCIQSITCDMVYDELIQKVRQLPKIPDMPVPQSIKQPAVLRVI